METFQFTKRSFSYLLVSLVSLFRQMTKVLIEPAVFDPSSATCKVIFMAQSGPAL